MEKKSTKKTRLAIVVSEFNSDITYRMLDRAKEQASELGATILYVFYVPGSFEMPLAVEALLKKKEVQAVVTLGAVIKGETRHDDIVAENASRLISDLSLKYGKPVALGISGPGMTMEQAKERAESVPVRAVSAAVEMTERLGKLEKTHNVRGSSVITIGLQKTSDAGGYFSH